MAAPRISSSAPVDPARLPQRWILLACLLLSGCRHGRGPDSRPARNDNPGAVPQEAQLKFEHAGRAIFIAEDNGALYIVDDHSRLVYSTDIRINQRLVFYPEQQQIIFGDQRLQIASLDPNRTYRFYFLKGS